MSDKLKFSLVSPERELFSGEVDHVVCPGVEGQFGVLPRHAPFMSTLKMGAVRILDGSDERRVFVRGGFADVTPDGLTILAEEAIDLAGLDAGQVAADLKDAEEDLADAESDDARAAAQRQVERLKALAAEL